MDGCKLESLTFIRATWRGIHLVIAGTKSLQTQSQFALYKVYALDKSAFRTVFFYGLFDQVPSTEELLCMIAAF